MQTNRGGFTIVESMIFLTISAVMFVGVIGVFRQSQASTEFSQSVRELESEVNAVLNDTQAGVFSNFSDVSCKYIGAATTPTITQSSGTRSGDQNGCIFLGKLISHQATATSYRVLPIIARNDQYQASSISDLDPYVVQDTQYIQNNTLKWQTKITKMYIATGLSNQEVEAAGVVYNSFGLSQSESGSSVSLYATTNLSTASNNAFDATDDEIVVCLKGGQDQDAHLKLGYGQSNSLSAVAVFEKGAAC